MVTVYYQLDRIWDQLGGKPSNILVKDSLEYVNLWHAWEGLW